MPCPNPRGFLTDGTRKYKLPCMKPTCPHCSKILKAKLLDHARFGFDALDETGHHAYFLTLTIGEYVGRRTEIIKGKKIKVPYKACNEDMGLYFARFRAYLAKPRLWHGETVCFRKLKYWKVPELQQRGALHYHIMIDQYIPYDILHDAWEWATYETSFQVKIQATDSVHNVAGYLSKYMTKNFDDIKELRRQGVRRYSMSKSWRGLYTEDYELIKYNFKLLPRVQSCWTFYLDPYEMGLLEPIKNKQTQLIYST